eukprot:5539213-Ditylum_brightwellii.AAC.1
MALYGEAPLGAWHCHPCFLWDIIKVNGITRMKEMYTLCMIKLTNQGRRMVTIMDRHIKHDNHYYIHKQATSEGLYMKANI